jgi:hypothetical protein
MLNLIDSQSHKLSAIQTVCYIDLHNCNDNVLDVGRADVQKDFMTSTPSVEIAGSEAAAGGHSGGNPAKWFASLDDRRIPVPRRMLRVTVIRGQGAVPQDYVIVRDHSSPDDEVLRDDEEIDLAVGNVFYTLPGCDARHPAPCRAPAKMALSVDDRIEETLNRQQTATAIIDLFGLNHNHQLVRDHESPNDEAFAAGDLVKFEDGPVFITRGHARVIHYTVDTEPQETMTHKLTPNEIMRLAGVDPEKHYLIQLKPGGGEVSYKDTPQIEIPMHEGMQFITASLCPTPVS